MSSCAPISGFVNIQYSILNLLRNFDNFHIRPVKENAIVFDNIIS
jgi:hypothetical protein